jgi:Fuc2NAc and GlcNAc transferase
VRPSISTLAATLLLAFAVVAAALLTGLVRRMAVGRGVLDVPNPRSSHQVPTPRGGGLAVVLAVTVSLLLLALRGLLRWDLFVALAVGGLTVALIGFVDDRRPLSAAVRLSVHFAAALWALVCLGGLPALDVGGVLVASGWVGYALGALGIVWALNLFNFMDGIDGIAASEAAFVGLGGAALSMLAGGAAEVALGGLVLAAACLGFLTWNWPPASIFLGDVGSGYLGYVIAVLAVADARGQPAALWIWLILGGVFVVDATVTLVRRTLRRERVSQAHCSHAYQWLARSWGSHLRVTLVVLLVDLLWLLPCAGFAALHPRYAALIAVLALAPLTVLALLVGAGRREAAGRVRPHP